MGLMQNRQWAVLRRMSSFTKSFGNDHGRPWKTSILPPDGRMSARGGERSLWKYIHLYPGVGIYNNEVALLRNFSLLVHNDPVEVEVSVKCQQTYRSMHDVRILRRHFVPPTSLLRYTIPCLREWTPACFPTTQWSSENVRLMMMISSGCQIRCQITQHCGMCSTVVHQAMRRRITRTPRCA